MTYDTQDSRLRLGASADPGRDPGVGGRPGPRRPGVGRLDVVDSHVQAPDRVSGAAPIKALTLIQPWASLVAIGAKRIETRSWKTSYRGPIAIHAAKGFPGWARSLCYEQPFLDVLTAAKVGPATFPLGKVVATARLVAIRPTVTFLQVTDAEHEHEFAFGDYSPGRYAWVLADVEPLPEPIPAKGALGLWVWMP